MKRKKTNISVNESDVLKIVFEGQKQIRSTSAFVRKNIAHINKLFENGHSYEQVNEILRACGLGYDDHNSLKSVVYRVRKSGVKKMKGQVAPKVSHNTEDRFINMEDKIW